MVGDLDPAATLDRVRHLFGNIRPKPLGPRPVFSFQPAQPASFSQITDQPDAAELIAMRLPGFDSPDFPALEVLSDVLENQRSALYGLVANGNALEAHFVLDPLAKASVAYAYASFARTSSADSVQKSIRAILERVAKNGVSAKLVEAAKLQERRQTEFQKNSVAGLASVWSDAIALYGLNSPNEDLARIERTWMARSTPYGTTAATPASRP